MTGGGTVILLDEQATDREMFKFSEVLSALSLGLDRVEGQPEGHVVRSCFVGMTIGEGIGLAQDQRSALFYALLQGRWLLQYLFRGGGVVRGRRFRGQEL
jgi:hypothetical protein